MEGENLYFMLCSGEKPRPKTRMDIATEASYSGKL